MRSRRVKEGKSPIQKPLCRLCECPTSDGHVLASQVDRLKLRKWAMKVLNLTEEDENLPDVVEEDSLICYFCMWHAEFGDESGDEAVAWWPKKLDLEENARVLRENYSVGDAEQCWVQLEEIDLAKYEKKIPKKRKLVSGVCFYCGNSYNQLMEHVKLMHKEAIKCGIWGCATFFHTEEEKEQHMQQVSHEKRRKPCERKEIRCKFCDDVHLFASWETWRCHMSQAHPEFSVACSHHGCKEYFKSKSELILHINSFHKQAVNQDVYQCKHCEFSTTIKYRLRQHVEAKHMPKIFKCDSCDAKFGSILLVKLHSNRYHKFEKCKTCSQDVFHRQKAFHRKASVCSKCKVSFECSGLYQLHRKSCKQTLLSCTECGKQFPLPSKLNLHVRRVHAKTVIFHCEHCEYSTCEKRYMWKHILLKHLPKTVKCEDCNKFFASESILKYHKQRRHEYVRCAECAQEIRRQNMFQHRRGKTCRCCKSKLKCLGLYQLHWKSCKQTLLSCKECGKQFPLPRKLNLHVRRVHAKSVIFHCQHCDYSADDKRYMWKHILFKHLPKTVKCDECDKLFPSESFLKHHKQRGHEYVRCAECSQEIRRQNMFQHRRVKTCRCCESKLKCSGLYQLHRKDHTKDGILIRDRSSIDKSHMSESMQLPTTVKCELCDKSFASENSLKHHKYRQHEYVRCAECALEIASRNMFRHRTVKTCHRCESKFKCRGILEKHKNTCKQTLFTCKECGESFPVNRELKRHIRVVHTNTAKTAFFCHHCEYSTFHKNLLLSHMQRNHLPKKIKCGECNKFFCSERVLRNHKYRQHEYVRCAACTEEMVRHDMVIHRRVKTCRRCQYKFSCFGLYQLHRKSCQGSLKKCEECGTSFIRRVDLNHHVKNFHTKAAILSCAHCDHSSIEKGHMSEHMRRKHFPKTVKCEECNEFFASESILKVHKYSAHSFLRCTECAQVVRRGNIFQHRRVKTCRCCKSKLKCSGLYQLHRKDHTKDGILICGRSSIDKSHMQLPTTVKCELCDKSFASEHSLKIHKYRQHKYVRCAECALEVVSRNMFRHRTVKTCRRCESEFKCRGLLEKHKKTCKKTLFCCKECGKSFTSSQMLLRHIEAAVHAKTGIFHCDHCDHSTLEKDQMRQHIQRIHFRVTIKCDKCDKLFTSESSLKTHKYMQHEYVRCAECAQEIVNRHMFKHSTVKACRRCECKLKCRGLLEKHEKSCCEESAKSSSSSFRCDHCDYSTFDKKFMRRHMQRKHLPKTMKCDKCDNMFASEQSLKRHKHVRHQYVRCAECSREMLRPSMYKHWTAKTCRRCEGKFKCLGLYLLHGKRCRQTFFASKDSAGKSFTTSQELETKAAILSCDHSSVDKSNHLANSNIQSDKSFASEYLRYINPLIRCAECAQEIDRPKMNTHLRTKICRRCKLSFKCVGVYQSHRKSCEESFNCKECGESFSLRRKWVVHMKKFHIKLNYCCEHCHFSSFQKENFQLHMVRMHLPKTIKCGECDLLFASRCELKRHKHKSHSYLNCTECAQKIRRYGIRRHQRVKTCRRCKSKFMCTGLLEQHNDSQICQSNNFPCDKCPKMFKHKYGLIYHISKMHVDA